MALETTLITVDGYKKGNEVLSVEYIVTKLPATKGLKVQMALAGELTVELIKDVIINSVSIGSVKLDDKKFDDYFSGRYNHLTELFNKVLEFNFDENFLENASEEM